MTLVEVESSMQNKMCESRGGNGDLGSLIKVIKHCFFFFFGGGGGEQLEKVGIVFCND